MDNMILGLLLFGSKTIYQLRERIDKGLNLMYSSSMGSIQAAIKSCCAAATFSAKGSPEVGNANTTPSRTAAGPILWNGSMRLCPRGISRIRIWESSILWALPKRKTGKKSCEATLTS